MGRKPEYTYVEATDEKPEHVVDSKNNELAIYGGSDGGKVYKTTEGEVRYVCQLWNAPKADHAPGRRTHDTYVPATAGESAHVLDKEGNKLEIYKGNDGGDMYKRKDGTEHYVSNIQGAPEADHAPGRRTKKDNNAE